MTQPTRRILAMGGGGFSMEPENLALDRFALALTGKERPHVAFVHTASGDADGYAERFFEAFRTLPCEPSILSLFRPKHAELEAFVMAQDLIYVGGGNTYNMLALWRLHGLDRILRQAWEAGIVLAGISAGALCWFEEGVTDSFGPLRGMACLGFLPGSLTVHYDGEAERRPTLHRLLRSGELKAGLAADDGAAVLYEGDRLVEAVASRPMAKAFRVALVGDEVVEEALPTRLLP